MKKNNAPKSKFRVKISVYLEDEVTPTDAEINFENLIEECENSEYDEYKHLYNSGTLEALEFAKKLAYNLGYDCEYCDGINIIEDGYIPKTRKLISLLVGDPWPEDVKEALNAGHNIGFWET